MPFHLRTLVDPHSTPTSSPTKRHAHPLDCDDSDDSDAEPTLAQSSARSRSALLSVTPAIQLPSHPSTDFLIPPSSLPTTAQNSPLPSRSPSPLPHISRSFISSASSSAYGSDTDEISSPLLRVRVRQPRWWSDEQRPWWKIGYTRRRRRKRDSRVCGFGIKVLRGIIRLPYFPTQPTTIVLSLLLFSIFALLVTLILIHVLNPDKEPLPWREYCSVQGPPKLPPSLAPPPQTFVLDASHPLPDFPPVDFEHHSPVGILLGVFSTDQAVSRRMLIRSTWARHPHSRNGAGEGDRGRGTSRTIVRFILGKPNSRYERQIQLEMETYNDIIILPIAENMNQGKTHAFFSWAASSAWVPPLPKDESGYPVTYTNMTAMPPALALHDPRTSEVNRPWVRPDFVIKADEDSFVMLAELEARLRQEMAEAVAAERLQKDSSAYLIPRRDPLIYWGYLVKNRFMAGELYALSWNIVEWVAVDPTVKGMTKGAEDKQVAKWMGKHPHASDIRWASEHCWIYDHPRAGTVYAHGYLFPSEASRVRRAYESFVQSLVKHNSSPSLSDDDKISTLAMPPVAEAQPDSAMYRRLSYSTVSNFGTRYTPPLPNLTPLQSVEALAEGSPMSLLRDNIALGGADGAWKQREGRLRRYQGKRVGGTIVVHFVKWNEWFLETALGLLDGDEIADGERRRDDSEDETPNETGSRTDDLITSS